MADDVQEILARLKVQNQAAFNAEMRRASGAVDGLTHATERNAEKTKVARLETFAWSTSVRILRAHMILGTFAVEAMIAETIHLGLEFDEARTKGMAAFTGILHSATKAKAVMAGVVKVGDETGLSLPGLIQGETRLLEMGLAGKQSLGVLDAISTFSQKRDLGSGGVSSLIGIFTRINQQGKLTGRTMLGLIRLGVPIVSILRDQLHLTDAQVKAIQGNKLAVPASLAIPALTAGLAKAPGELGLFAEAGRVRNIMAQIVGGAEEGGFVGISKFVGRFADRLQAGLDATQKGGGVRAFLMGFDPSGRLDRDWNLLSAAISGVAGALSITFRIGRSIFGLFTGLTSGEGLLARRSDALRYVVEGLTLAYIGWKAAILLGVVAKKADAFWTVTSTAVTKGYEFWVLRAEYATNLQTAAVLRLKGAMIGLSALGGAALVIAITYELAKGKNDWLRDKRNGKQGLLGMAIFGAAGISGWIADSRFASIGLAIALPFAAGTNLALHNLDRIKTWIVDFGGWLEQKVFSLHFGVPGLGTLQGLLGHAGLGHIPGIGGALTGKRATGGPVNAGGRYLVGEHGPEVLTMGGNGHVTPLQGGLETLVKVLVSVLPADIVLDHKKIGTATFRLATDVQVG